MGKPFLLLQTGKYNTLWCVMIVILIALKAKLSSTVCIRLLHTTGMYV
jgi:hypothetical protein